MLIGGRGAHAESRYKEYISMHKHEWEICDYREGKSKAEKLLYEYEASQLNWYCNSVCLTAA